MTVFSFFSPPPVHAAEQAGNITKFTGKVMLYTAGTVRGSTVQEINTPIHVNESIHTKTNSQCFIRFVDNSKIVLKENSALTIAGIDRANVDGGAVLFEIKKRGAMKGLEISSATVTIGVKGTRFAVHQQGNKLNIYLKDGVLELLADKGKFKRYRDALKEDHEAFEKKLRDDFEATRKKMKDDFETSKKAMQEGKLEYVKSFEMNAGSAISIDDDNEVWNIDIPDWVEKDFSLLDGF